MRGMRGIRASAVEGLMMDMQDAERRVCGEIAGLRSEVRAMASAMSAGAGAGAGKGTGAGQSGIVSASCGAAGLWPA